jgi:hypothetical protein
VTYHTKVRSASYGGVSGSLESMDAHGPQKNVTTFHQAGPASQAAKMQTASLRKQGENKEVQLVTSSRLRPPCKNGNKDKSPYNKDSESSKQQQGLASSPYNNKDAKPLSTSENAPRPGQDGGVSMSPLGSVLSDYVRGEGRGQGAGAAWRKEASRSVYESPAGRDKDAGEKISWC